MKCACPNCHVELTAGADLCASCRIECVIPSPQVHEDPAAAPKSETPWWPFLAGAIAFTAFGGISLFETARLRLWMLFAFGGVSFLGWAGITFFLVRTFVRETLAKRRISS